VLKALWADSQWLAAEVVSAAAGLVLAALGVGLADWEELVAAVSRAVTTS